MRISGGAAARRIIPTADLPGVRPTQDRVREALFSSIAPAVPGARVLDLFAGTGSLGLEAWSRGAAFVAWVERERAPYRALCKTVSAFAIPPAAGRVISADAFRLLALPPPSAPYDLVLADPPYAEARLNDWLPRLAALLAANRWLAPGGLFVYETEGSDPLPGLPGLDLLRDRRYGRTRLLLFRHSAAPAGGA